jgi:hypothetical protein
MFSWKNTIRRKQGTVIFFVACVLFVGIAFFFFSDAAFAQEGDTFGVEQVEEADIALPSTDIRVVVARIIRAVLGLLGLLTVILMIYGGFLIMTSAGSEEKVAQGKKVLINTSIGLAIILSAFTITQFIINALTSGIAGGPGGVSTVTPTFDTFGGSGSLGRIIEDHYPMRDQVDVPRNTKIVVTFSEPMDPESLMTDDNGSGIFGDCVTPEGASVNIETDCDRLRSSAVAIYPSEQEETAEKTFVEAAAQALLDENGFAETFVFRPFEPLGNNIEPVEYTVDLLDSITKADGETSAFLGQRSDHYLWTFETGTTFDFTPPYVSATYPAAGGSIPRNTIVQIGFNEPVDPVNVEGLLQADGPFSTIIFGDTDVSGEWQITNGYRTVEFLSDLACGQNSCGDVMYCLPVDCPQGDISCETEHTALVRTAEVEDPGSDTPFVSIPFTGVADMAGNALDNGPEGTPNGIVDIPGAPTPGAERQIAEGELAPDNYWWNFVVENRIDRTAPYILRVIPGLDQQDVGPQAPFEIVFSKPMSRSSARSAVAITEYPANIQELDDIWFQVFTVNQIEEGVEVTKATVQHRAFGPNNLDLYYFPEIASTARGVNQNCLYPGRGPDSDTPNIASSPVCSVTYDESGFVLSSTNCVDVNTLADTDTGCVIPGAADTQKRQPNTEACIGVMEANSPSDLQ